jgi:hypothetical protein
MSALAVAGASFALAACGSSDSSSSTSTTAAAGAQNGTARNADFQKYQQCLKDNGVTLPDRGNRNGGPPSGTAPSSTTPPNGDGTPPQGGFPGGGGAPAGVDATKFKKAQTACAKLRPQGGGFGRGGYGAGNGTTRPQTDIKAFTPYLTCLKDQGLDVKVSDGFNALRNLKQTDPKVQAAFKACQSKLPQRPQGNGSGSSTTTPGTTTNGTT